MNKSLCVFLLALNMTFVSCGDDDGPQIEIIAPVDGNSYKQNTSVDIELRLTDDEGLSTVQISNPQLGINSSEDLSGQTSVSYSLTVNLGFAEADKYEFDIQLTDIDNNTEEEKLEIEVVE